MANTRRAVSCQAPENGTPDQHCSCSQSQGLEYVGAATDAPVHINFTTSGGRLDDFWERFDAGDRRIKLPSSVIGDDDTFDTMLYRQCRILGGENSLEQERERCDATQPRQHIPGEKRALFRQRRFLGEIPFMQVGRQGKAITDVFLSTTYAREIDGQDNCTIASCLGT